jgi:hypothetical protein
MTTFTSEIEILAKDWFRRCRESQMVHYEYGSLLERRHLYFGIPAMVLSTIVGTAVFSSWESASQDQLTRVAFGMLSMLAASITALQTFLNLTDRASKHKSAGASYSAIRRELELLKTIPPLSEEEMKESLQKIKQRMDDLANSAPGIPSRFKQKIDEKLESKSHDRVYQLTPSIHSEK